MASVNLNLIEDSEGWLECIDMTCQTLSSHWCPHIKVAIDQGADAALLWDQTWEISWPRAKDAQPFEANVKVPIVPESSLWTTIGVVECSIDRTLEAHLKLTNSHEFLGFLNPGEGRLVLLSMLNNYIFSRDVKWTCNRASHGFKQQVRYENNMKSRQGRYSEVWSLFLTNMCITCYTGIEAEDFSDLVPDPGKVNSPF